MQELEIISGPQGLQQQVCVAERIFFFAEGKGLFVQAGPRLLAIHTLKPYPTWSGFKPNVERAWRSLVDVVEVKGLERIGLRYINRIEIPSPPVQLEDYFEFYVYIGKRLPQDIISFIACVELPYLGGRDRARVQLREALSDNPNVGAFFLDIDYFLANPQKVDPQDALNWVEQAHSNIQDIFEGCITDRLRALFKEVGYG